MDCTRTAVSVRRRTTATISNVMLATSVLRVCAVSSWRGNSWHGTWQQAAWTVESPTCAFSSSITSAERRSTRSRIWFVADAAERSSRPRSRNATFAAGTAMRSSRSNDARDHGISTCSTGMVNGPPGEIRTPDQVGRNHLLCPLSYGGPWHDAQASIAIPAPSTMRFGTRRAISLQSARARRRSSRDRPKRCRGVAAGAR